MAEARRGQRRRPERESHAPDLYGVPMLPGYLRGGPGSLTPGLGFGMYAVWKKRGQRKRGEIQWQNELDKDRLLKEVVHAGSAEGGQLVAQGLVRRLNAVLARSHGIRFELTLTSPLATGLGNEHPVENGFTFSVPHGLPLLPGSSIKGTVRAAAERLALRGEGGWDVRHVWLDFGFDANAGYLRRVKKGIALEDLRGQWREAYRRHVEEAGVEAWDDLEPLWPSQRARERWRNAGAEVRRAMLCALQEGNDDDPAQKAAAKLDAAGLGMDDVDPARVHLRGALVFHDGWFTPAGGNLLKAEVMTPHFSKYHQEEGGSAPTDDMAPVPIPFLAVPEGCGLHLGVARAEAPGGDGGEAWRDRLLAAVRYAAENLGFGAKGGAGYGRARVKKKRDPQKERRQREAEARKQDEEAARRAELEKKKDPVDRICAQLEACEDAASSEQIAALYRDAKNGGLLGGERKTELAEAFRAAMLRAGKWPAKKAKKWQARVEDLTAILVEGKAHG